MTQLNKHKYCNECGAKIVEYKHSFSAALAYGLHRLYLEGIPINIKHLGLNRNQWDNFQKLRYWGLVEKSINEIGKRIGGCWSITQHGIDFIEGRVPIQKSVWTYRGDSLRFEGNTVFFIDIHDVSYRQRIDYSSEAQPHGV